MKSITFNHLQLFSEPEIQVRSNREQLILDIVNNTDAVDKKKLARRIAITANQLKWSDTDLHALLKKKNEVRNYSKFVNWTLKTRAI